MTDAVALALNFILQILQDIPNNPFMFLFGLAIVIIIIDLIFDFVKGGFN